MSSCTGDTLTFVLHAVRVAVVPLVVRRREGRSNGGSAGAILAMAAIDRSLRCFIMRTGTREAESFCCGITGQSVLNLWLSRPPKTKEATMVLLMVW